VGVQISPLEKAPVDTWASRTDPPLVGEGVRAGLEDGPDVDYGPVEPETGRVPSTIPRTELTVAPTITKVAPTVGSEGTLVAIIGKGFFGDGRSVVVATLCGVGAHIGSDERPRLTAKVI
jgi:hypothetical protein